MEQNFESGWNGNSKHLNVTHGIKLLVRVPIAPAKSENLGNHLENQNCSWIWISWMATYFCINIFIDFPLLYFGL